MITTGLDSGFSHPQFLLSVELSVAIETIETTAGTVHQQFEFNCHFNGHHFVTSFLEQMLSVHLLSSLPRGLLVAICRYMFFVL